MMILLFPREALAATGSFLLAFTHKMWMRIPTILLNSFISSEWHTGSVRRGTGPVLSWVSDRAEWDSSGWTGLAQHNLLISTAGLWIYLEWAWLEVLLKPTVTSWKLRRQFLCDVMSHMQCITILEKFTSLRTVQLSHYNMTMGDGRFNYTDLTQYGWSTFDTADADARGSSQLSVSMHFCLQCFWGTDTVSGLTHYALAL